jgi:hypothetical protein
MTNAVAASHAACKRSKGSENAHSSLLERRATGERERERRPEVLAGGQERSRAVSWALGLFFL